MMTTVNILWLYDDLLDLYGDSGNLRILTRRLKQMRLHPEVTRLSIGDKVDFSNYQMVYIGPGKAKNLAYASEHLMEYRQEIKMVVRDGVLFFVTGNARLLFGREFIGFDGKTYPGVGLFDYTGRETGDVFISDVVFTPAFDSSVKGYGFINRTAHIDGNNGEYLFHLLYGAGDNETETAHEGNLKNNFFGTWQLGPILVKNPRLLKEVLRRLTGPSYRKVDDSMEQKALELTLAEFSHLK